MSIDTKDLTEQDASTLVLRSLAGAEPSAAVKRRLVEGALARRRKPELAWHKPFIGLALAGAAAAAVVVAVRVPSAPPAAAPVVAEVMPEAPPAGSIREVVGTYAVGLHRISLEQGARLRFDSTDPGATRLGLEAGLAHFAVHKLATGESFQVKTGQVLVEVVGTRFDVQTDGSCSRVAVSEGRVKVTDSGGEIRFLTPGESLRSCAPTAAATGTGEGLIREAMVLVSEGKELEKAAGLLSNYRTQFPDGAFQEEALFHLTVVEAKLGRDDQARDLAGEFARRFPNSQRAEKLQRWLDNK